MTLVPEGRVCTTILSLYNTEAIVVEPAGACDSNPRQTLTASSHCPFITLLDLWKFHGSKRYQCRETTTTPSVGVCFRVLDTLRSLPLRPFRRSAVHRRAGGPGSAASGQEGCLRRLGAADAAAVGSRAPPSSSSVRVPSGDPRGLHLVLCAIVRRARTTTLRAWRKSRSAASSTRA